MWMISFCSQIFTFVYLQVKFKNCPDIQIVMSITERNEAEHDKMI